MQNSCRLSLVRQLNYCNHNSWCFANSPLILYCGPGSRSPNCLVTVDKRERRLVTRRCQMSRCFLDISGNSVPSTDCASIWLRDRFWEKTYTILIYSECFCNIEGKFAKQLMKWRSDIQTYLFPNATLRKKYSPAKSSSSFRLSKNWPLLLGFAYFVTKPGKFIFVGVNF